MRYTQEEHGWFAVKHPIHETLFCRSRKDGLFSMEPERLQELPKLELLGTLDTLVLQSGRNDDDGNNWRPKPDAGKLPPVPLTRGIFSYLLKKSVATFVT